jgi:hypothetical protein
MCRITGYFVLVFWLGKWLVCMLHQLTTGLMDRGVYVVLFVHGGSVIVGSSYNISFAWFEGYVPSIVLQIVLRCFGKIQ